MGAVATRMTVDQFLDSPMLDLSVVLSGKLDPDGSGRITVAPEIAIEIVS